MMSNNGIDMYQEYGFMVNFGKNETATIFTLKNLF